MPARWEHGRLIVDDPLERVGRALSWALVAFGVGLCLSVVASLFR